MSGCRHGTVRPPLDGFSWNVIFEDFSESLPRNFKVVYSLYFESIIRLLNQLIGRYCAFRWLWWTNMFVEKIQVWLKSNKNNGYFTWRPMYICDNIWLNSFRVRTASDKIYRENQYTHFMFKFFSQNLPFFELMWKNMAEPVRAQLTVWNGADVTDDPGKDRNTHLLLFHGNSGYANEPEGYVIRA